MFGSKKIAELETRVSELNRKLDLSGQEKAKLTEELASARGKIAGLEKELNNLDIEQAKKELESSKAEYEGLKELYTKKIAEFDASHEEKEQEFARQAAVERLNLDNEIKEKRRANEEYISGSVKSFSDSYNYYLNQIRLLMDALGNVASKTGNELFSGAEGDLKARLGSEIAGALKAELDPLKTDSGDLLLISSAEGAEGNVLLDEAVIEEAAPEKPAEKPAEKKAPAKKPAAKKTTAKKPAARKPAAKKAVSQSKAEAEAAKEAAAEAKEHAEKAVKDAAAQAKEKTEKAAENVKNAAAEAKESAEKAVSEAKEKAEAVKDVLSEAKGAAAETAKEAAEGLKNALEGNK